MSYGASHRVFESNACRYGKRSNVGKVPSCCMGASQSHTLVYGPLNDRMGFDPLCLLFPPESPMSKQNEVNSPGYLTQLTTFIVPCTVG